MVSQMRKPPSQAETDGGSRLIFVNRFFHPDISATSQILSDLAFHLAEQGHDVHVVCSPQLYQDPKARLLRRECVRGLTVHRIWSTRFGRYSIHGRLLDTVTFLAATLCWLLLKARTTDVVIAKTDPPMLNVVASVARLARRFRLLNWLQDLFPEIADVMVQGRAKRLILAPLWWLLRVARNFSLRHANMNVAIGKKMATRIEALGIDPAQITIAHNWSPGEAVVPVEKAANPLVTEWGLQDKFVVMYSGNMGRVHDFDTLFRAAVELRHHPQIMFVLAGAGPALASLKMSINTAGLQNVIFRDYQPASSLAFSLSVADVHIVTLKPEMEGLAFPSKLYGILASGRPTLFIGDITGDVGSTLSAAGAGTPVAVGDAQSLAAAIRNYASRPDLLATQSKCARQLYAAKHSRRVALAKWESTLVPLSRPNQPPATPLPSGARV